ncbi:RNA polymerase sigma factor [Steroidobacter sp.]|uniref:RNA polymerase sigma factor n=1 Tax=Steroidobacter sp. TaxID=1978227 RepID=UPI001A52409F|nr:RNA polymerase sigma factor [Steroidobacter sp.]MBL8267665.1 RNA polymerase sigma factor [Steroidobacter sp.]
MSSDAKIRFLETIEKDHGRQLRRYLAFRMRDAAADVQDLAQEVFLRLLRIERHEAIRNPQAYLYTVASHVLHQHLLRRAATPETVEIADVLTQLYAIPDTDPLLQAERDQRFEELRRQLRDISPGVYATLVLHRYYGMPLGEISQRLGVSYSMTKKYLARALKYIEQLREQGREEL